jgi:hypothetical protein
MAMLAAIELVQKFVDFNRASREPAGLDEASTETLIADERDRNET